MIYLHIGRHKSGTTSIQRFLARNRDVLLRNGFCYPDCAPHPTAHHPISIALRDTDGSGVNDFPAISALSSEEFKGFNFIFSSEGFQSLRPHVVSSVFSPGETKVVVYIREQLEYSISSYLQRIQASAARWSFQEYLQRIRPNLYYGAFLNDWADKFGSKSITVRIFDRSKLEGGDVVTDFCSQVGLDKITDFSRLERFSNPSLTYPLLVLKLFLNRHLSEQEQRKLRIYAFLDQFADTFQGKTTPFPVKKALVERYRDSFREGNRRMAETWFGTSEDPFNLKPISDNFRYEDSEVSELAAGLLESREPAARRIIELCLASKDMWPSIGAPERILLRRLTRFLEARDGSIKHG